MKQKLTEAVNIAGAEYIGTDHNFDVFDVRTYDAAQSFRVLNTSTPAGQVYISGGRTTFETYITDTQHLYFFVTENTNHVFAGVVKGPGTSGNIQILSRTHGGLFARLACNFLFETVSADTSTCAFPLPLYLIPGAQFTGVGALGELVQENELKAVLPQCVSQTNIDTLTVPANATSIAPYAFGYGVKVETLIVPDTVLTIQPSALAGVTTANIEAFEFEAPAEWPRGWDTGCQHIVFGYGKSDEDRQEALAAAENAAAARAAERERAEREAAEIAAREAAERAAEEARIQAERDAARIARSQRRAEKLRYRIVGKEVTITGAKRGVKELEIPAEIEGKPVTRIGAYAFFDNAWLTHVTLPATLKIIEQGAFANCFPYDYYTYVKGDPEASTEVQQQLKAEHRPYVTIYYPMDCVIGKDAVTNSRFKLTPRSWGFNESLLNEANIEDEYARNYSAIDRDTFNKIVATDPRSNQKDGIVTGIGFGAKQLLLPHYLAGETDWLNDPAAITNLLTTYYQNQSTYPSQYKNLANFKSIADFAAFVNNPETAEVVATKAAPASDVDSVTAIYDQYYKDQIDREMFDKILDIDPTSTRKKVGEFAKNFLLPRFIKGDNAWLEYPEGLRRALQAYLDDRDTYPKDKQDIRKFNSIADFMDCKPASPALLDIADNNITLIPDEDYKHIASTSDYDVFKILTYKASDRLAHSRLATPVWCTAGGANGARYSANRATNTPSSYWLSYTDGARITLYEFLSRTYPQDPRKNFNLAVKPEGVACEFRDGENDGDGSSLSSTDSLTWKRFISSHPELAIAIYASKDMPICKVQSLKEIATSELIQGQTLVIEKYADFGKLLQPDGSRNLAAIDIVIRNIDYIPAGSFAEYGRLRTLIIEAPVKAIGAEAFKNCINLRSIEFPETLESIGPMAFSGDYSLKGSIKLPNSLRVIGEKAFEGTHCRLKVDEARTTPLRFNKNDKEWINAHVKSIKVQN